jgi:hypothetical protein
MLICVTLSGFYERILLTMRYHTYSTTSIPKQQPIDAGHTIRLTTESFPTSLLATCKIIHFKAISVPEVNAGWYSRPTASLLITGIPWDNRLHVLLYMIGASSAVARCQLKDTFVDRIISALLFSVRNALDKSSADFQDLYEFNSNCGS